VNGASCGAGGNKQAINKPKTSSTGAASRATCSRSGVTLRLRLRKSSCVSAPCPLPCRGAVELQVVVSPYQRIYRVVARIPRGRVATYGQIADLAGLVRGARQVGYALAALRDDSGRVPWHRVLNARGEITTRFEAQFQRTQRELLESEGVVFDVNGRVSLQRYQWRGVEAAVRASRPSNDGQRDR
jgi:methylated-DNA-protein-cysteine methyltransferase-like protein